MVTGLAAVVAAVIVGLRQAGIQLAQARISSKQTEILAKQVGLEELKLRNELFDRRFDVYRKTQSFIGSLAMIERAQNDATAEIDFLNARDIARFLFHERTRDVMLVIYELGLEIVEANRAVYAARNEDRDVTPHLELLAAAKARLQPVYNDLHASFPELWLAEVRNHPG